MSDISLESDICRTLPHRYPFLFVDQVTEFVPGQRIAATKCFSVNDEAARGYLPAAPLIPVGILLELVTQLGAILVMERPEMAGKVPVILQIPSASFIKPVASGDKLRVEAEVIKMREGFGELRGAIYREGELVGEGRVRFAIADVEKLKNQKSEVRSQDSEAKTQKSGVRSRESE